MDLSPQQLSDIEACREAARRYCRGVDRLDAELMRSAYWPDATDDHGVFVGNAMEFVDRVIESHRRWAATMHCIYNHSVELDPGGVRARGEAYNVTYLFGGADGPAVSTWWGRYLDAYERRSGEWRIIERVCVHEADRSEPTVEPMAIDSQRFRPGSDDRDAPGHALGP